MGNSHSTPVGELEFMLDATNRFKWVVGDGYRPLAGTWELVDELGLVNTSETINDEVEIGAFWVHKAGNHRIYLLCSRDADCGIASYLIDGVEAATEDLYNGSHVALAKMAADLGTLATGIHSLVILTDSKNGSASHYKLAFRQIFITRHPGYI